MNKITHNKGQINKAGFLEIEHSGRMELMQCIYKKQACGDFCVGFGEPKNISHKIRNQMTNEAIRHINEEEFCLFLCTIGKIHFKQFKDLRVCNG